VLVSFGPVSSGNPAFQNIIADKSGRIQGTAQVATQASAYLLTAMDVQKIANSMTTLEKSGQIQNPMTYIAATLINSRPQSGNGGTSCVLPALPDPIATCIASKFNVSSNDVMSLHVCENFGFGEIERAFAISKTAGVSPQQILTQAHSLGWGSVYQQYGTPGSSTCTGNSSKQSTPDGNSNNSSQTNKGNGNGGGNNNGNHGKK